MGETSNHVSANMALDAVGRSRGTADITDSSLRALHKRSKYFTHVVTFNPHENP